MDDLNTPRQPRKRGRPGGNPEIGTKYRLPTLGDEPLSKKQFQVRLPVDTQAKLDQMPPDERNQGVRNAIASWLNDDLNNQVITPLLLCVIEDAIAIREAAIRREGKAKRVNQRAIATWRSEIEELNRILNR